MPEKDSGDIEGSVTVNYPAGFTKDNCVVVSLMSHNARLVDQWATCGGQYPKSIISEMLGNCVVAILRTSDIQLRSYKTDNTNPRNDVKFKIVLMKLAELVEGVDYVLGDVNGDGQITQADVDLVNEFYVGTASLTDKQLKAADVNKDGKITPADATKILQYIAGTITKFD